MSSNIDWRGDIGARARAAGVTLSEATIEEMAEHLEEIYMAALRDGASERDAQESMRAPLVIGRGFTAFDKDGPRTRAYGPRTYRPVVVRRRATRRVTCRRRAISRSLAICRCFTGGIAHSLRARRSAKVSPGVAATAHAGSSC